MHPELPVLRDLYNDGDMLFFANTGVMSKPVNKDNYYIETKTQLFSHNHMQRETQRLDPYDTSPGTGSVGRMADILHNQGFNVASFSIDGFSVALSGKAGVVEAPMIVNNRGITKVQIDNTRDILPILHNVSEQDSGMFAETWSSSFMKAIGTNDLLGAELEGVTTTIGFPDSYFGRSLNTVSRLIATRDVRGVDLDTFFVQLYGKYLVYFISAVDKSYVFHSTI